MNKITTVEELDALRQEVGHLVVMTDDGPALVWMGEDQGWHSVRACTEDDWAEGERRLGVPADVDLDDDDCLPLTVLWHDGMHPLPDTPAPSAEDREALVALSEWIDAGNAHRDPEAVTWGRLAKITEEAGEVIAAYIGATGQNPRKGVTHDTADVVAELLDVAVTALGAVEHLRGHDGAALDLLAAKIVTVAERAGVVRRG